MKMDAMTIKKASAMPAPTWSWLKMNSVDIEVPDGLGAPLPRRDRGGRVAHR